MFKLIRWLFKQEFKNHYTSAWYLVSELASLLLGLFIYKMTSKALSPHLSQDLEWMGLDYFSFVILGEALLMVPLQAFSGGGRIIKGLIVDGIVENFICWPGALKKILTNLVLATLVKDFLYILVMLIIAKLFFGISISWMSLSVTLVYLLLFIPGFFGLGMLTSAIVLYLGRGQGLLGQISGLLSVMSGVYFPLGLFSDLNLNQFLQFQPFSYFLITCRNAINIKHLTLEPLIYALAFAFIAILFGSWVFNRAVTLLRQKGLHLYAHY
ncbi:MAG: hypothetical protein H6625_10025 [Bdellovibrionaceae bacterium]|nr:hypothetical protein [Pseudobdellovibrionaceae bacterium]